MRYKDIPRLTSAGHYQVNMPLRNITKRLQEYKDEMGLNLEPIFQRGHVWTEEQQIKYVEYLLRGGESSRTIYFNCPWWHYQVGSGGYRDFVCVDGLQRLTAVCAFMENKIPAFGLYCSQFDEKIPYDYDLLFNVNDLKTEQEVLQWYIDLNEGGTPHTKEEILRVKSLLNELNND